MSKEIKGSYIVHEYMTLSELEEQYQELINKAVTSREQAYAPYSRFLVGASVRLSNGKIITGNNQENAAYPSGLCAERVAIFSAGALFPQEKIQAIAITCRNSRSKTTTPQSSCGACRQSMLEYELKQDQDIKVFFMGESGPIWEVESVKELLPLFFHPEALD